MSGAGDAVRNYRAGLAAQYDAEAQRFAQWQEDAKRLRFAWAEGHDTLYKYKSLSGKSKAKQVFDIIENSRIYFSVPNQFNDPLDCSPVFKLARDPPDEALIAEMEADEAEMRAAASPAERAKMKRAKRVGVSDLASGVTLHTRKVLRAATKMFCLSARHDHPLLWAHYADSHRGVCLHFRCRRGSIFGAARAVEYQEERRPIFIPLRYNTEDQITDAMSRAKAKFWREEEEYRIIEFERLEGRFGRFEPELLCGITLGMEISSANRKSMLAAAARRIPAIAVYQTNEDPDRFWVSIQRIA
jgi:hypothetical protein